MNNKLIVFFLGFIIILAATLRLYKLASIPPSLNWDEVAASYNAYTIEKWGRDEYGKLLPVTFRSFGDDKHPVHIYTTALFYLFFGVNDFTTRLPSVCIGLVGVVAMFFIASYLLDNIVAGLFSSLLLAVSPYAIHYSRGLWEANFAVCLFLAGLALFGYSLKKNRKLLPLAYLLWGLSLLSYHASKVVVPPLVLLITVLYIKRLLCSRKVLVASLVVFLVFVSLILIKPELLGLARMSQTGFSKELVAKTYLYEKTGNELLGRVEVSLGNFKGYYSCDYLFVKGDQEPRGSVGAIGEFYRLYMVFVPLGVFFLLRKKKNGLLAFIIMWILLAPMPGALAGVNPNSTRAIFMLGPFEILAGYAISEMLALIRGKTFKVGAVFIVLIILAYETTGFVRYYFTRYPEEEAVQWQYGFKDIVEYVGKHPEYSQVFVTKIRNQPYIFFLNYLHYPLPEFLSTVKYDETGSKSYNTVESFGRFRFGNWNPIDSEPIPGYLYVLTKNEYEGLKSINMFDIKKVIFYPGGDQAYYIVSGV